MIAVRMSEHDDIDLARIDAARAQRGEKPTRSRPPRAYAAARVDQHSVAPGVDEKADVRQIDHVDGFAALDQDRRVSVLRQIRGEHLQRVSRLVVLDRETAKSPDVELKCRFGHAHASAPTPARPILRRISWNRASARSASKRASTVTARINQ
jgi:hypothetical protein